MKKATGIIVAALVAVSLFGCSGGESAETTAAAQESQAAAEEEAAETEAAATGDTLKFAVMAPITGNYAEFGTAFKVATQMAADEINAAGGVNGKQIELEVFDSKGDATESVDVARQLVNNEEILGVIGDFSSTCCMANAPIFGDGGLVQLSPTCSHSDFAAMNDYQFSIMGLTADESKFFVSSLIGTYLEQDNIGIIYANDDWGNQVNNAMLEQAEIDGITVVADESYTVGEMDFTNVLNKVKNQDPDLLVLIMQPVDCSNALNAKAQIGWDIDVVCQGASSSMQVIELAGENAEDLYSTTSFFIDESDPEEKAWNDKFVSEAGFSPTVHAAVAYDAVYVMAEAAKKCGDDVTREGIKDGLKNLGKYEGFTGPIEFDEDGNIFRKVLIVHVEDGKYVRKTDYDYGD